MSSSVMAISTPAPARAVRAACAPLPPPAYIRKSGEQLSWGGSSRTYTEMHLCADTINDLAVVLVSALDERDHSLDLRIIGIEVEVVDVQFGIGVRCARSFERNGDEGLSSINE